MYVDDLNAGFAFEILAQPGDVHIHVAGVVEAVVAPDLLEGIAALEDVVFAVHEHSEQLCLARGDVLLLPLDGEGLPFFVKKDAAEFDDVVSLFLRPGAA